MKALVVDDDLALADVVGFTLRRAGYEVVLAHDGKSALQAYEKEQPDILVLDINLPGLTGIQVCQRIRAISDTPIIFLSVLGNEDDVVQGLKLGADDYIVKPFSPRQLVARMEAVLRRSTSLPVQPGNIQAGDFLLDVGRRRLTLPDGRAIQLSSLETKVMEPLLINRDQVLTFETLLDAAWGIGAGDRTALKQLIYRLRQKIEADPGNPVSLLNVPSVGYIFTS